MQTITFQNLFLVADANTTVVLQLREVNIADHEYFGDSLHFIPETYYFQMSSSMSLDFTFSWTLEHLWNTTRLTSQVAWYRMECGPKADNEKWPKLGKLPRPEWGKSGWQTMENDPQIPFLWRFPLELLFETNQGIHRKSEWQFMAIACDGSA